MATNFTKTVDDWYNTTIRVPVESFLWNKVQAWASMSDCPVSTISGTNNLVYDCWDYAWTIRGFIMLPIVIIILSVNCCLI